MPRKKFTPIPNLSDKEVTRFGSYVDKRGPDECWYWRGFCGRGGYGHFTIYRRGELHQPFNTHRLAYFIATGVDPGELMVCHSCDARYPKGDISYRKCCNPAHLWTGTAKDNADDAVIKGRWNSKILGFRRPFGVSHWKARLSEADVLEIRRLFPQKGWTRKKLADKYRVGASQIKKIIRRDSWKHI